MTFLGKPVFEVWDTFTGFDVLFPFFGLPALLVKHHTVPGDIENRQTIRSYPCKACFSFLPLLFPFQPLQFNTAFPLQAAFFAMSAPFFLILVPLPGTNMADRLGCAGGTAGRQRLSSNSPSRLHSLPREKFLSTLDALTTVSPTWITAPEPLRTYLMPKVAKLACNSCQLAAFWMRVWAFSCAMRCADFSERVWKLQLL